MVRKKIRGQGENSDGTTTIHLRRRAVARRAQYFRMQHREGVEVVSDDVSAKDKVNAKTENETTANGA